MRRIIIMQDSIRNSIGKLTLSLIRVSKSIFGESSTRIRISTFLDLIACVKRSY